MPISKDGNNKIQYTAMEGKTNPNVTGVFQTKDFRVCDSVDELKQIKFDASGVTTNSTVTVTFPSSGTVAIGSNGIAGADTQVQFNNNGSPGASANFTFNTAHGSAAISTVDQSTALVVTNTTGSPDGLDIFQVVDLQNGTGPDGLVFSVGSSAAGSAAVTSYLEMDMQHCRIFNLGDPADPQDAATQAYVDSKATFFVSTEQTGNGSSQNIAHGFGSTPTRVLISVTAASGAFTVTEGTHDSTNVKVTVTNGVKYKVWAQK